MRGIGNGAFCTSTAGMDNWYFMGTRSISLVMKCSFLRPTKNSWTKNTVFQLDYFTVPLPSIVNRLLYLKFTKRFQSYKCRSIIIPKKKILVILWVPKNRRRSAPTRIFFHGTHRFTPSGIGIVPPGILLLGSLQELGPATAKTQFGLNLGEGKEKTQLPPNVLEIRWKNLRTSWWENINQLLFSDREFLRASSNYNSRLNSQFVQKWYMKIMKWSLGLIFFLGILGQLIFRSALEST